MRREWGRISPKTDFRIERVRPKQIREEEYEELREAWIFTLMVAERTRKMYRPWEDFKVFCYDIGVRLSSDHYFGQFLSGHGYFPLNCGWITTGEKRGFLDTVKVHEQIMRSGYLEWEGWKDIFQFINDVGARPSLYYGFGRIVMDEGYHPRNCRWMTRQQRDELANMGDKLKIRGYEANLSHWSYVLVDYLKEEEYPRINKTGRGEWSLNPNVPKSLKNIDQ